MSHVKPSVPGLAPRPNETQRQWLESGLKQPGGKLPTTLEGGEPVPDLVMDACLNHGWAERWMYNPLKPNWKVCRLTETGRSALSRDAIVRVDFSSWQRDTGAELHEAATPLKTAAK